MTGSPLRVAIEGPCCAGKTTLGHGLEQELHPLRMAYVSDYYDYARSGGFFPRPVPSSATEAEHALEWLLDIEGRRTAQARAAGDQLDVILLDRSIHTLLAHRYALKQIGRFDDFHAAQDLIGRSIIPLWPDFIIYLDMAQEMVHQRNKGKFEQGSIFIDAAFNRGIRSYFQRLTTESQPRVVWLDAAMNITSLRKLAATQVNAVLRQCGNEREAL